MCMLIHALGYTCAYSCKVCYDVDRGCKHINRQFSSSRQTGICVAEKTRRPVYAGAVGGGGGGGGGGGKRSI